MQLPSPPSSLDGNSLASGLPIHAYKVYNKRLMIVKEYVHVVFDESNSKLQDQVSIDVNMEDTIQENQGELLLTTLLVIFVA